MSVASLWNHFSGETKFPTLDSELRADVAIIGGGICGISVAQELAELGLSVIVLEARKVGGGTTAHSTGNLYATTDKNLKKLCGKHGLDVVRTLTRARLETISKIESNVNTLEIDCDFRRGPWFLYSATESAIHQIDDEYQAAREIGLEVSYADLSQPYRALKSITMPHQARVNSMLYVQGLAQKIQSAKCRIFENTQVRSIEKSQGAHKLETNTGHSVSAAIVVHATHIPKGVKLIQSFLGPYREYGIACKVKNPAFEGTMWGYHGDENFVSSRFYERGAESFLIVVGEPRKVGQNPENARSVEKLCEFARAHFEVQSIPFKWGGQHYRPADHLPYLGREEHDSDVFIATGFSTDGLVYGALAGRVISALVRKEEDASTKLLSPTRGNILKSMPNFLKENVDVGWQYLKDLPHTLGDAALDEVPNNSGKVIEHKGQKIAAYRSPDGQLKLCSAVCSHMKCIVNWNDLEKSWDCPCHGSRFDASGCLLEGPALHNLHTASGEEQ